MGLVLDRGRFCRQLQLLIEHLLANVLKRHVDEWVAEAAMHGPQMDARLESLPQPVERRPLVLPIDLQKSDRAPKSGHNRHLGMQVRQQGVSHVSQEGGVRREVGPGCSKVEQPGDKWRPVLVLLEIPGVGAELLCKLRAL